jgi:hypothetical protein
MPRTRKTPQHPRRDVFRPDPAHDNPPKPAKKAAKKSGKGKS